MTIFLQWLVDNVWVFYVACVIGAIVYLIQALAAQRELRLAMFSLERGRARARITQSWVLVFVFIGLGALIFFLTVRVLPELSIDVLDEQPPTATMSAGLNPPTVTSTAVPFKEIPTDTPVPGSSATGVELTLEDTEVPGPTVAFTETPAMPPTDTVEAPQIGVSGEVRVQLGQFARLVGFSLPSAEVRSGEPIQLTLYWEALQTPGQGYQVFTHLLSSDGRLIAQHDGAPAGGTRPTDGWAQGESVIDLHPMVFLESDYIGEATIAVGMYDPATGRLKTESGDDSIVLPVTVNVVSQ